MNPIRREVAWTSLAESTRYVAAFLELSSDDVVNPDEATRALEYIAAELARASPVEIAALRRAAAAEAERRSEHGAGQSTLAFFQSFGESFGLEGRDSDER